MKWAQATYWCLSALSVCSGLSMSCEQANNIYAWTQPTVLVLHPTNIWQNVYIIQPKYSSYCLFYYKYFCWFSGLKTGDKKDGLPPEKLVAGLAQNLNTRNSYHQLSMFLNCHLSMSLTKRYYNQQHTHKNA